MLIGIDPGISGAIAWVADTGHLIRVADMPTIEVHGKKKVSPQMLVSMLEEHDDLIKMVAIEDVGAMKGNGAVSMFNFGYGAGILAGVCAGLKLPVALYRPAVWKRAAGVPADKGAARQMAQRFWPGCRDFDRAKDDGRAEAALLARWVATKGNANA
jgi:Holliday junction resolvasome RuvABC endonuclease subunit